MSAKHTFNLQSRDKLRPLPRRVARQQGHVAWLVHIHPERNLLPLLIHRLGRPIGVGLVGLHGDMDRGDRVDSVSERIGLMPEL